MAYAGIVFEGKVVLVTGGTGSFGKAFTRRLLSTSAPRKLIIFSRDEMKQWHMEQEFPNDDRLRFFIGDVRDRDRLYRALDGVDIVVHAAATKIVPTAEYNPFEAVKTNISGAMNLADAAIDNSVQKVVALSTDKASSPVNLYGATKLVSDKIFTAASSYSGAKSTSFSVVRYGNVMGSRGSVIPAFLRDASAGRPLKITHPDMTRFMISLDQGVDLILTALKFGQGGEIFVSKIPSMGILEIAEAVDPGGPREVVGVRPGEKLHEQMIGVEDAPLTREFETHFRITPAAPQTRQVLDRADAGAPVQPDFSYTSRTNPDRMSVSALTQWIEENRGLLEQSAK